MNLSNKTWYLSILTLCILLNISVCASLAFAEEYSLVRSHSYQLRECLPQMSQHCQPCSPPCNPCEPSFWSYLVGLGLMNPIGASIISSATASSLVR